MNRVSITEVSVHVPIQGPCFRLTLHEGPNYALVRAFPTDVPKHAFSFWFLRAHTRLHANVCVRSCAAGRIPRDVEGQTSMLG